MQFTGSNKVTFVDPNHDFFSRFVRLSARSSPKRTRKFESPVCTRGGTSKQAGDGKIQGHLHGLPKSRTSNEEFNARGNPNHIQTFYVRE